MFCVDASVIISAARGQESRSEDSKAFLDSIKETEINIFLPESAVAEIASGLIRATKNENFSREFIYALKNLPNFSFVPVDGSLIDLAVDVIFYTGLRSADAIYVALARKYGLTLITLDREQLARGGKIVEVREPSV